MDEEQHEWDRLEGEPAIWYQRFTRFRLMFPVRSIAAVYHAEHPEDTSNDVERRQKVPGLWYKTSRIWRWQERAAAWDDQQTKEDEEAQKRVLKSGLALQYKRILALQERVEDLIEYSKQAKNVWLMDVRSGGLQFNDSLYKEIREYITDIADEVGGRVKKKEITEKGDMTIKTTWGGKTLQERAGDK